MRHFHAIKWNWCKLQNFNFWINTLWFHCYSLKQALCFGSLTVKETKSLKNYQQSFCQFKTGHWILINACTCKHLVPVGKSQRSMTLSYNWSKGLWPTFGTWGLNSTALCIASTAVISAVLKPRLEAMSGENLEQDIYLPS